MHVGSRTHSTPPANERGENGPSSRKQGRRAAREPRSQPWPSGKGFSGAMTHAVGKPLAWPPAQGTAGEARRAHAGGGASTPHAGWAPGRSVLWWGGRLPSA
eukprot:scaffold10325_cov123-Isochrysis_galbana.AAC.3